MHPNLHFRIIPVRHLMTLPHNPVVPSRIATISVDHFWTRHCPACRKLLHKTSPLESWICTCGWRCP